MNAPIPIFIPDFAALKSWPAAWEFYRQSPYREDCLSWLIQQANLYGEHEWRWAAQACLDDGTDHELNALVVEQDAAEQQAEDARAYELRAGREWEA